MEKNKLIGIIALSTLAIFGIGWLAVQAKEDSEAEAKKRAEEIRVLINENETQTKGNESGIVTVAVFSDFTCPYCSQFSQVYETLASEYQDRVQFKFFHFPIEKIQPANHKNGLISAYATESAGEQGLFWEMHDILYQNQSEWLTLDEESAKVKFTEYALSIGVIDIEKYNSDFGSEKAQERIQKNFDLGLEINFSGTPAIFVNGLLMEDMSYETIKNQIELELVKGNE